VLVVESQDVWSGHKHASSNSGDVSIQPISLQGFPVMYSNKKRFTKAQSSILFQYIERNLYPSSADYDLLVSRTGLTRKQIIVWFQNHRASFRRRLRSYVGPICNFGA